MREPDVDMSQQFRNGEDISKVVEKLQHISLDSGESIRTADGHKVTLTPP